MIKYYVAIKSITRMCNNKEKYVKMLNSKGKKWADSINMAIQKDPKHIGKVTGISIPNNCGDLFFPSPYFPNFL